MHDAHIIEPFIILYTLFILYYKKGRFLYQMRCSFILALNTIASVLFPKHTSQYIFIYHDKLVLVHPEYVPLVGYNIKPRSISEMVHRLKGTV